MKQKENRRSIVYGKRGNSCSWKLYQCKSGRIHTVHCNFFQKIFLEMNTSFQNLIKDLKKIMKIFFYFLTGKQEFYRLIQRAISTFESVYPTSLNPKTSLQRPRITMSWYYSSRFVLLKTYLFSCTLISSISILVEKWVFIQNLKDSTIGLSFKNLVLFIFFSIRVTW